MNLGSFDKIAVLHRISMFALAFAIAVAVVVHDPRSTSEPAASPGDRAREDLSRVEYPSTKGIAWDPHFIRPQDSLERLFGSDWVPVARFNRIDRRHAYPGMTIKVPRNMDEIRNYNPLPMIYEPARPHRKYILVDATEQWIGAYEHGKLRFSGPAATGTAQHPTPEGLFRVDAHHRTHSSSLYKTERGDIQYPMDYAFRFYVGPDNAAFWAHARDMPGRPASHGCIGLYDENMQNRVYGYPDRPVLNDAKRFYEWLLGPEGLRADSGELRIMVNDTLLEVRGPLPRYLDKPPKGPS